MTYLTRSFPHRSTNQSWRSNGRRYPNKFRNRALGLRSLGLPTNLARRGPPQGEERGPKPAALSQATTSCQARSLTALWIATTLSMSLSAGDQPFRRIALKNICCEG